ncbi:MAG TPA: VOC family protein [Acidimicrobiales bacterium]|jgi:catechol 2,3-dioxygenase-like lactoylglutathione lyase family enzyme|nr:VOC family protein [Acidimicrobiales bacterium]
MLGGVDLIAFVGTADVARARSFYEGTLGLAVVEEDPYALALDANGTMLRVTAVPDFRPAGHTVCGWRVDNIATAIRELGEKGVGFARYDGMDQDELGAWTAPSGAKVAWFADPDGNTLSLTQFP